MQITQNIIRKMANVLMVLKIPVTLGFITILRAMIDSIIAVIAHVNSMIYPYRWYKHHLHGCQSLPNSSKYDMLSAIEAVIRAVTTSFSKVLRFTVSSLY